ncbi:MAG: hypothetical protein HKP35_12180, partial [Silicimonas sp.]|nr:hypothetical protein [Silicimonas sp.]
MELQKAKRKSLNLVGANSPVPVEFGFEDEHPAVSLPFGLKVCGQQFVGSRISMTAIHVVARDEVF